MLKSATRYLSALQPSVNTVWTVKLPLQEWLMKRATLPAGGAGQSDKVPKWRLHLTATGQQRQRPRHSLGSSSLTACPAQRLLTSDSLLAECFSCCKSGQASASQLFACHATQTEACTTSSRYSAP